jgi:undecaprenyl diphosphate synthase
MKNSLKHLAIIMDGNGRWATIRGLSRTKGHEAGALTVRRVTEYCANHRSIETLTLYAFSTENWNRPAPEVKFLMALIDRYLQSELPIYMNENVKFDTIGDINKFSKSLINRIKVTKEATKNNSKLTQILALNYGGRDEITRAVNKLVENKTDINEQSIGDALDTPYTDIDLMIRTSGEQRISNFLLWQLSYSEFIFTDTLWPDFGNNELSRIISDYQNQNRRFGGL